MVSEGRSYARPNRQEDLEPWYRQFWPWFLIALPGSVVIASLSTLYIANRYSDDLVVDDYYKDGLAINVELGKQRVADGTRHRSLSCRYLTTGYRCALRGDEYGDDTLDLFLSHPLEADRDFSVSAASHRARPLRRSDAGNGGSQLALDPAVGGRGWRLSMAP